MIASRVIQRTPQEMREMRETRCFWMMRKFRLDFSTQD